MKKAFCLLVAIIGIAAAIYLGLKGTLPALACGSVILGFAGLAGAFSLESRGRAGK